MIRENFASEQNEMQETHRNCSGQLRNTILYQAKTGTVGSKIIRAFAIIHIRDFVLSAVL